MYQEKFFKLHNEKYAKVLDLVGGGGLLPQPRGKDPTLTNSDGWVYLNPQKVYTNYKNNLF
jgi:hypothetical protein